MNTTLLKIRSRQYTTRINLAFTLGFIASFLFAYSNFLHKKQKDPTIPWFAFFFKIEGQPSWTKATPFKS